MVVLTLKAKHDHLQKVAGTRDFVKALGEQADDVIEALEAAVRLQRWWNESRTVLATWATASTI